MPHHGSKHRTTQSEQRAVDWVDLRLLRMTVPNCPPRTKAIRCYTRHVSHMGDQGPRKSAAQAWVWGSTTTGNQQMNHVWPRILKQFNRKQQQQQCRKKGKKKSSTSDALLEVQHLTMILQYKLNLYTNSHLHNYSHPYFSAVAQWCLNILSFQYYHASGL